MSDTQSEITPAPPVEERGRQDGIATMLGTARFSGSGVSINLEIPPDGGSLEGTSGFRAGGAPGFMVPGLAISLPVSLSDEIPTTLSCTDLPKATIGAEYAVAVQYTFNNASRILTGVVRGTKVLLDTSVNITLS